MELNPQLVEKISADIFWRYVFENGLQETLHSITENLPPLMWSLERAQKEMEPYLEAAINSVDLHAMKKRVVKAYYEEVLDFILSYVRAEKNIMGPIYVEDCKDCKDPDFKFLDLLSELKKDSDENCDYEIVMQGDFDCIGTLLLRTPFPSGVLIKKDQHPGHGVIMIEDTQKALGFHKTLMFACDEIVELPPNPEKYDYFISGFFYLPTRRTNDNRNWFKLIPNTTGMCEGSMIMLPSDLEPITVNLKQKNKDSMAKHEIFL